MAKVSDSLTRRQLLNAASTSAAKLSEMGQEFASQGFLSDAVDFFAKAKDREGLARVLDLAMDEGDYFLFTRINKILGLPAGHAECQRLADRAEQLGKLAFAGQARAKTAGPEDRGDDQTGER
jgi:hypothetical protein